MPESPPCDVKPLIALFGGTFDPIHYGHLNTVQSLAAMVGLDNVILMPNNVPPHRAQPEASAGQRLHMVELALAGMPSGMFSLDDRELRRQTPSWTFDTFTDLRSEWGTCQPLAFIIGLDSLLTLPTWHRGTELLALCHLLVCARPGYATHMAEPEWQSWLETHVTDDIGQLHRQPAGCIYLASTPLLPISASQIRDRRHQGLACDEMLPPAVLRYIDAQGLYR